MKKLVLIAAVVAGVAFSVATSQAQVIVNSGAYAPIGVVYVGGPGVPSATITPAFSTPPQSGVLTSQAFLPSGGGMSSGLTDPAGYTGVAFAFQVSETGSDFIDHISLNGFILSSVFIEYAATGSSAPSFANLFAGTITIDFSPQVQTGKTSDTVYVFTTASSYQSSTATVDDGISVNTQALAPIPEASTVVAGALMLLPLGIGAVRAIRKERAA